MNTRNDLTEAARARRSASRWTWLARSVGLLLLLAVLATVGYLMISNASMRGALTSTLDENAQLRDQVDALYEQVIAAGEDPVTQPDEPTVIEGLPGERGPRGEPGRAPTAEEITRAVVEVCASSELCVGPAGAPGAAGKDGADGQDGESVVGPPGPQGPKGDPGESIVGPPGPAGEPGAPGSACPEGSSPTSLSVDTYAEGDVLPTRRQIVACVPIE